jgi:hypothetical protein
MSTEKRIKPKQADEPPLQQQRQLGSAATPSGETQPPPPPPPPPPPGGAAAGGDLVTPMDCSDTGEMYISKAAAYLKKIHAENVEKLRGGLEGNMLQYDAIKRSRLCADRYRDLKGGNLILDTTEEKCGSFFTSGDGRLLLTGLDCKMSSKQCWSFSFDRSSLKCKECSIHGDRPFLRNKGDKTGGVEVIVMCDQAFPAILHCGDEKKCLKIARLENARLDELSQEWIDMSRNKEVARGTLVLLASISHMQRVGTAAYCEDFCQAVKTISEAHGGKVEVLPLPVIASAGITCPNTIRTWAEINCWIENVFAGDDWYLADSFRLARSIVTCENKDDCQTDYSTTLRLPMSWKTPDSKISYKSAGWDNLPKKIKPANSAIETSVVSSLLSELRTRLALDLCLEPSFERGFRQPKSAKRKADYMVIGSSNATKTSVALNKIGCSTVCVHSPGWRISQQNVAEMLVKVKETMATTSSDTIVLQAMDNSVYFGRSEDGGLRPAIRGDDGKHHVEGDLEILAKDRQMEVLNMLIPLLDQLKDSTIIFIAPLPRYYLEGCCDERTHVANRFQREYKEIMLQKLADMKNNIKNFMFINRYRNVIVMDPAVDIKMLGEAEVWGVDPVHPMEAMYSSLARSVTVLNEKCKAPKRPPSDGHGGQQGNEVQKRSRGEVTATSNYTPEASRGWHPSHGPRGMQRGFYSQSSDRGSLHVRYDRGGYRGRATGGGHTRHVYFKK